MGGVADADDASLLIGAGDASHKDNRTSDKQIAILPNAGRVWHNFIMRRLELTLPTPAENLALDEALLDWAEDENPQWEFLRLWESPEPMVVVGRSTRVRQEVHLEACRDRSIPVLRRSSGGAAIAAGPGCLMYALVLSYALRPELKDIGRAHALVLRRLAEHLNPLVAERGIVRCQGTSDLVIEDRQAAGSLRKFSGNSLRAKRSHCLYHGTLLYDNDLTLIETCLQIPPRQPDYRRRRPHREFITNLPVARAALVAAIDRAWPTSEDSREWPRERVAALVRERFSHDRWNLEFE